MVCRESDHTMDPDMKNAVFYWFSVQLGQKSVKIDLEGFKIEFISLEN